MQRVLIISENKAFIKKIERGISILCELNTKFSVDTAITILKNESFDLIVFNIDTRVMGKIIDFSMGALIWVIGNEKVDAEDFFYSNRIHGYVYNDNLDNVLNSIKSALRICELNKKETFGDRLRILREENRLTQVELSEIIGATRSVVSSYEVNTSEPNITRIKFLAKYFKVSIDYLLGD
jgi:DNA-binding XRE family transcriptional regulator